MENVIVDEVFINVEQSKKTFLRTSLVVYEIYIIIHSIISHKLKYVASTVFIFSVFDVEAYIKKLHLLKASLCGVFSALWQE
jgi:hypothetical protein